jgi:cell wall-associated NlpC family hydrolase
VTGGPDPTPTGHQRVPGKRPTRRLPVRAAGRLPGRVRVDRVAVRALVLALACGLVAVPAASIAAPQRAANLAKLREQAAATRARLDGEQLRLEQLAEELKEAYAGGVDLLAQASKLQRRQAAADRELADARAKLDARVRASYIGGPASSYLSALVTADDPAELLRRLPLQQAVLQSDVALVERVKAAKTKADAVRAQLSARLVEQAGMAQTLAAKQAEAQALADRLGRELRTMDRRMKRLIAAAEQREEANRRLAFDRWMAGAQGVAGLTAADGAAPAARKAVQVALAQLGAPYRWGATGPNEFDCSGLMSFAYRLANAPIPRTSRTQYAALAQAGRSVAMNALLPGDLVFFATDPGNPATIHHVGMYVGKGLMVHAPHTGDVVRTASVWRNDFAGAVRPAPARR